MSRRIFIIQKHFMHPIPAKPSGEDFLLDIQSIPKLKRTGHTWGDISKFALYQEGNIFLNGTELIFLAVAFIKVLCGVGTI